MALVTVDGFEPEDGACWLESVQPVTNMNKAATETRVRYPDDIDELLIREWPSAGRHDISRPVSMRRGSRGPQLVDGR
jgi:hypothetical protein